MSRISRRRLLRGALGGANLLVALPLLDCFLDGHGEALADGRPLPRRFGTYFWGLGLTPKLWVPSSVGRDFAVPPELAPLQPFLAQTSVLSGFKVALDGRPNFVHWSGQAGVMSGVAPKTDRAFDAPTFDTQLAEVLGKGARFRSIEATPFGNPRFSYSTRTGETFNPPETTPLTLYERLFGAGFSDPNAREWRPDPGTLLEKSVISAVAEQRSALLATVGAADRSRLDQYFTSLREVEQQLANELVRPEPAESFRVPARPKDEPLNGEIGAVRRKSRLMAQLLAMALAGDQTRVFNLMFSGASSELYLPGDSTNYHQHSHEEPIDDRLGYQPFTQKLAYENMQAFAEFLGVFAAVPEGSGTMLDRMLILGYSDTGFAKVHSVDNIPLFLVGGASGRHRAGAHVAGGGSPVTRAILTAQQLMGSPTGSWGVGEMQTDRPISELIA